MSDHPWPEHISDRSSDRSDMRLETLKDLKLFQNYNQMYHKNRLMYKEHLNNKMASLWSSRSTGSITVENLKRELDDSYSSYVNRHYQEFQQSVSESSSGKDFSKSTEKIWQQRVSKHASPAGLISDQEGLGRSCITNRARDGFLPKLNARQEENQRIIKARQRHAKQENGRVKGISAPTCLPNINRHSHPEHKGHSTNRNEKNRTQNGHLKVSPETFLRYSGHSDGQTASSMLNNFRYFIRMKNKARDKSIQKDESFSQNRSPSCEKMTSSNHCTESPIRSLTQKFDSFSNSLDSCIDDRTSCQAVTAPKCNTIIPATSPKFKTSKSEEANEGDTSKDAESRPAQALYKVIFRTRDENGFMVITAIGINQAALMR